MQKIVQIDLAKRKIMNIIDLKNDIHSGIVIDGLLISVSTWIIEVFKVSSLEKIKEIPIDGNILKMLPFY